MSEREGWAGWAWGLGSLGLQGAGRGEGLEGRGVGPGAGHAQEEPRRGLDALEKERGRGQCGVVGSRWGHRRAGQQC